MGCSADVHCKHAQVGPAASTKDCYSCGGGGWGGGGGGWGGNNWGGSWGGNSGWDQSYQQPNQQTNINNKCAPLSREDVGACELLDSGGNLMACSCVCILGTRPVYRWTVFLSACIVHTESHMF